MKVICVLGVHGSGKTTHCENLIKTHEQAGGPRPFFVPVGRIARDVFGAEFFAQLKENSAAPEIIEHWVRYLISFVVLLSAQTDHRVVILDGFPRKKEQFHWLMLSSPVSDWANVVEMRFLNTDKDEIAARHARRKLERPGEAELDDRRMMEDALLFKDTKDEIICALNEQRYPKLSCNIIEVDSLGQSVITEVKDGK